MPIIIAVVVIVVGIVAFTMFQSDPIGDTEPTNTTETSRQIEEETDNENSDIEIETEIEASTNDQDVTVTSEIESAVPPIQSDTNFEDGSYTTQVSYFTPRRTEHIMDITLTIENDIVVDTEIVWDGDIEPKTPSHSGFDAAYESEVVGRSLSTVNLSRVGGASLTSEAFNEAVQAIEVEARAS